MCSICYYHTNMCTCAPIVLIHLKLIGINQTVVQLVVNLGRNSHVS